MGSTFQHLDHTKRAINDTKRGTRHEEFQAAQCSEFELYLVDLLFSDGTGFDLIKKIRTVDRVTPIVVCSGDARASIQKEATRVGVQAFLTKPIDPDRMAQTITALLDKNLSNK